MHNFLPHYLTNLHKQYLHVISSEERSFLSIFDNKNHDVNFRVKRVKWEHCISFSLQTWPTLFFYAFCPFLAVFKIFQDSEHILPHLWPLFDAWKWVWTLEPKCLCLSIYSVWKADRFYFYVFVIYWVIEGKGYNISKITITMLFLVILTFVQAHKSSNFAPFQSRENRHYSRQNWHFRLEFPTSKTRNARFRHVVNSLPLLSIIKIAWNYRLFEMIAPLEFQIPMKWSSIQLEGSAMT